MKTLFVNTFSGGMTAGTRSSQSSEAQLIEHFDAFTDRHKLTPFRSYVSADASASTNQILQFDYYSGVLYGNGIRAATSNATVFTASTVANGPVWTDNSFGSAGSTRLAADLPFFKAYKGYIYGARGARYLWRYQISNGAVVTTDGDLTAFSTVSNGLLHSKDDVLYMGYDNKIATLSSAGGAWVPSVLTLPTNCYITSLSEYGNYLAIATATTDTDVKSTVYLWDRDSSLTTLSEKIDWGAGTLSALEELDGALIGVTQVNSTNTLVGRIVFKSWTSGSSASKFQEYIGQTAVALNPFKQKINSRLFVSGVFARESANHYGFWGIGRQYPGGPFGVSFERLAVNDSSTANISSASGFIIVGDFLFNTYTTNAAAVVMVKTDFSANYTATSAYESLINPAMSDTDRPLKKKLMGIGLFTSKLSSGQQAVIKYRVDGGSWVTVLTKTSALPTTDLIGWTTATPSATQFVSGREYEFRIESTGGAEITGFAYKYDPIETLFI